MVLVSTRNPLNIGAAARAMSNFGFSQLRAVNPYDLAFREARSAVGAAPVLAQAKVFASVAEAVADCSLVVGTTAAHNRELHHPMYRLAEAAPLIRRKLISAKVALLFGSEKRGLSNHDLSYCHWLLHIPTEGGHLSMNLGQAVAVCLYELGRAAQVHSSAKRQLSQAADLDILTATLVDTLRISGYLKPRSGVATDDKIRRLVRRLNLSSEDAETWLGMLRQMTWKMKSGE